MLRTKLDKLSRIFPIFLLLALSSQAWGKHALFEPGIQERLRYWVPTGPMVFSSPPVTSLRELLKTPKSSYQETQEWKVWGPDSFLSHEWMVSAPSANDIFLDDSHLTVHQLILYRYPFSESLALYGENYSHLYFYSGNRFSRGRGEALAAETKTVVGLEKVFNKIVRLRLPLFWEIKHYPFFAGMGDHPWRHGLWFAPQLAIRTGPKSELLLTISTLSFVDGPLLNWNFSNLVKTSWHHLLFRLSL
ncbi:hypothetical protein K2X33_08020 [bacterium]|nr:hypothetical protein [bacterium]